MINNIYITPHPPIVVPEVGLGEEEKISKTINSFKKMAKEVAALKPQTIIITSPHQTAFRDGFYVGKAKSARGDLRAFGADVELDKAYDTELASLIAEDAANISFLDEDFVAIDHGSLVPLYFIDKEYKDYELVLIGISGLSAKEHYKLGQRIEQAVEATARDVLMIASGDLSHCLKDYGPYGYKKEGEIFDEKILEILETADFKELINFDPALINAADQCGIKSFQIMAGVFDGYKAHSEKWSYDNDFGVGYGFFKLSRGEKIEVNQTDETADNYIKLASLAIEEYVKTGRRISADLAADEIKVRHAGAFVTIYKDGSLRGCIGTISPYAENLAEEIINNAISACSKDPRFMAVRENELADLDISVDVLGEMEDITSKASLDPKTYGVVVSSLTDNRRGLLLPHLEGVDTIDLQVSIALNKAGMDETDSYKLERFMVERHD